MHNPKKRHYTFEEKSVMNKERYIICLESTHLHSSKLGPILFISIIYDFGALLQTHYL